jgi:hypothetical protein
MRIETQRQKKKVVKIQGPKVYLTLLLITKTIYLYKKPSAYRSSNK